jgi:glycosyltransferase involved in cell wall biosynthesis
LKISVITPSYNQAPYLITCLKSVSMQTYTDIEHIVIDGGSTDQSIQVLEEFKKDDNRVEFLSETDSGQGDAVNKGFAKASGDIVSWINSDDYYFDKDVFQFVADFFKLNPNIDIIYGGMAYVDSHDDLQHIRIPPRYNYSLLTRISYIGNTNTFFRRKVIERYVLDDEYHFVIDHEYMLRITKEFKAFRTKRMIACFRVHPEAKTQTLSDKSKDIERNRRDLSHNINRGFVHKILQFWSRFLYRLSLAYTDWRFLKLWKNSPPYKGFIK